MSFAKFTVCRSNDRYLAWPDIEVMSDGRLLCCFTGCTSHLDRRDSQVLMCESRDLGRSWGPSRPLTELSMTGTKNYYYNNSAMRRLSDGLLVLLVDRICGKDENKDPSRIILYTSRDDGKSWDKGTETPALGIVPDKLFETSSGRWLIACHQFDPEIEKLVENLWYSDDRGKSWTGPVTVARHPDLNLCEASIIEADGTLVCFMRENSWQGYPAYRAFSTDDGLTWSDPVAFPLPGCHRPKTGYLSDGRVFITYRFTQGGRQVTQNLFAGISSAEGILARDFNTSSCRILPIDYDAAEIADTGYSGWVQFSDGDVYIVNYVLDGAQKAYIRGCLVPVESLKTYGVEKQPDCLEKVLI